MSDAVAITVEVNGTEVHSVVPARVTLADYLRERHRLTGIHLGCEQGVCGACTVLVDGRSVRSCLMLAAQVDGGRVSTVEGLAAPGEPLSELQRAFADRDALQCGFCTPGLLMACTELLEREELDEPAVRSALSGNLCRCTGYSGIVSAVLDVHAGCQDSVPEREPCVTHGRLPSWAAWSPEAAPALGIAAGATGGSRVKPVVGLTVALAAGGVALAVALERRRRSAGKRGPA